MLRCYGQLRTRECASKETVMPTRRFARMILARFLARFLASGCAIVLAVCVAIKTAQAQYIPPPTPLPPPVFNPSNPYTVAQPPYRSIAPSTPSTASGYVVNSPVTERLPRATARSHHRTSVANSAKAPSVRRGRATVVRAAPEFSYDYSAYGYGDGCAWRRAWDGYWFRASPCS